LHGLFLLSQQIPLPFGSILKSIRNMPNRDIQAAWTYHNATKHSFSSIRTNPHFLDWANRPLPFKIYSTLPPLPLPRKVRATHAPTLSAIAETAQREQAVPDLESLSHLLYFSAGVTRRRAYPGGEIDFRAAACTGALYEIELYLACGSLPDLEAGLYHFAPADFALRKLRAGDYRGVLVDAAAAEPSITQAPVVIISTGTYWRNAWKYQARTYRHFGWDNGTLLANLLATSTALELPAKIVCGFVDDAVNGLLDVDPQREVALSLVPIGKVAEPPSERPTAILPLGLETVPLSQKEVDYPAMREMHAASSLLSSQEVLAWRGKTLVANRNGPAGERIQPQPLPEAEIPREPIEQVILRRGSTRHFAREAISFALLSTLLDRSTRGVQADFLEPLGTQLNHLYLIAHAVEGLRSGAYFFDRERRALELLKEGDFRSRAGYLGLEQDLPADASVAIFFLADLPAILEHFGNRGYRAVQLEAGIIGGKLYLGAYALHLGATGLTFYDDDVVNFFSPHATGKSAIFLVALGKSAKGLRIS
jgi:SagB-type dehydrogenase family enzyme